MKRLAVFSIVALMVVIITVKPLPIPAQAQMLQAIVGGGANTKNLVGQWLVNEGGAATTVLDQSGHGNTGTWTGTASCTGSYYTTGYVLSYAGCPLGASYVALSQTTGFPIGSAARSMSAWIYMTSVPSTWAGILAYGTTVTREGSILGVNVSSSKGYLQFSGYSDDFNSNLQIQLNTWYLALFTYTAGADFSGMKLYLNGSTYTSSGGQGLNTINSTQRIGFHISNTLNKFPGYIEDVRLCSVAMGSQSAAALLANGPGGPNECFTN